MLSGFVPGAGRRMEGSGERGRRCGVGRTLVLVSKDDVTEEILMVGMKVRKPGGRLRQV